MQHVNKIKKYRKNSGFGLLDSLAIYGRIDTNCNVATLYSKTTNSNEETAINLQVKNICLYLQTKKFTMSRFFYFTPIYPSN